MSTNIEFDLITGLVAGPSAYFRRRLYSQTGIIDKRAYGYQRVSERRKKLVKVFEGRVSVMTQEGDTVSHFKYEDAYWKARNIASLTQRWS